MGRKIDLSDAIGLNIGMNELLPQFTDVIDLITCLLMHDLGVGLSISLGFHGEF